MLIFYPAGKIMDVKGRAWIAVPCMGIMAVALVLLPLTHGVGTFMAVAMLLGFGNGIGSGIVLTMGVDYAPVEGRAKFLGLWRLMADAGAMGGPVMLSGMVAVATLGVAIWSMAAVPYGVGVVRLLHPRIRSERMDPP